MTVCDSACLSAASADRHTGTSKTSPAHADISIQRGHIRLKMKAEVLVYSSCFYFSLILQFTPIITNMLYQFHLQESPKQKGPYIFSYVTKNVLAAQSCNWFLFYGESSVYECIAIPAYSTQLKTTQITLFVVMLVCMYWFSVLCIWKYYLASTVTAVGMNERWGT